MNKIGLLLFCLLISFTILLAATPDSTRISYKIPAKVKVNKAFSTPEINKTPSTNRMVYIDSLQNLINLMAFENESLLNTNKEQSADLRSMNSQLVQLSEENKNLASELTSANGDKLQSSHTNSILYIFNVMLGIIMLVALVWLMGRKKSKIIDQSPGNGFSSNGKREAFAPSLDHQLERIEKLGNLREKGLLTDDEFNFQKRQILAERS